MSPLEDALIQVVNRLEKEKAATKTFAEECNKMVQGAEALVIHILLSNGGSLPLVDSFFGEAASGAWTLHEGGGRIWIEKKGKK